MRTVQYQVGGSLMGDASSYVVREADDALYQALLQREFCYVLNARQMGKSSLMVRTRERLQQQGYRCVTLDLTNIGSENITPLQWYKGIVKDLWRSFKLLRQVKINDWWKDEADISLLQRLSYFIGDVLLKQFPDENLIIFVDEIDSILSLPFSVDDFFALIRFCYNQRATDARYQRINFAIFGVATPSDLIRDRTRTPFNIGTPIKLDGLSRENAQLLAEGLTIQEGSKQLILKEILDWTQGQPFLTQKLCQLAISSSQSAITGELTIPPGSEAYWVEQLVMDCIIKEWESQDEPEHLRTIRNRILNNPENVGRLLGLYQRILNEDDPVAVDSSREQIELVLAGLVVQQGGCLRVKNPIYARVFNRSWVEQQLSTLRPYAQGLEMWLASRQADESRLLRGQALRDAQTWSRGKRLGDEDYQFLAASVESDRKAVGQAAEAERIQLTLEKEQQTNKLQRRFLGAVSTALLLALGFGAVTFWLYRRTQIGEIEAIATAAEGHFESHYQLEALQQLITAKTKLGKLYAPPAALNRQIKRVSQRLLDRAYATNQLSFDNEIEAIDIHPDGDLLAVVTSSGDLSFWQKTGEPAAMSAAVPQGNTFSHVAFSPDGQRLAVVLSNNPSSNSSSNSSDNSSSNQLQLWTLSEDTFTVSQTFAVPPLQSRQITFLSDGNALILNTRDGPQRLEFASGEMTLFSTDHRIGLTAVSDGGGFVAGSRQPLIIPGDKLPSGQLRPARWMHPQTHQAPPDGPADSPRHPPPPHQGGPHRRERPPRPGGGPGLGRRGLGPSIPNMQVWDLAGNLTAAFTTIGGPTFAVAANASGTMIASAHVDGEILLTRPNGEIVRQLYGLRSKIAQLAFSPDGNLLAVGDNDGGIHLWTISGSLMRSLLGHRGKISQLRFSPDGTWLASASQDSTVRLWNVSHPLQTMLAGHTDVAKHVFYSRDGNRLYSLGLDQRMNVWQRGADGIFETLPKQEILTSVGSSGFSISSDRQLLTQVLRHGAGVTLLPLAQVQETLRQPQNTPAQISPTLLDLQGLERITAAALSSSGQRLAISEPNGQIHMVEASPEAETVLEAFSDRSPKQTLTSDAGRANALTWNPDETLLVSGHPSGQVNLWKDGIATSLTESTPRESTSSSQERLEAAHQAAVSAIAVSPDNRWIATASKDKTVKIWNRNGKWVQTLAGHEAGILSIAFSPDSRRLVSAGVDGQVNLWQVGEAIQTPLQTPLLRSLTGHIGQINSVSFSPDGRELATTGTDRRIIIWKIDEILQHDELSDACDRIRDYLKHHPTIEPGDRDLCD